jgi:hypothetical protein
MTMVTVIGRGNSGTRLMSQTLRASGVYMGARLNESGDLVPAEEMYEACRVLARHVTYLGGLRWDFSRLHTMPIDPAFTRLLESYLASVLDSAAACKGWKVPETTLAYPWVVRLFPEARYLHWVRDPRDCILGKHLTDDLADFGIPCDRTDDVYMRRAMSWKYQAQIVQDTPPPRHVLAVPFECFVLRQDETLAGLEPFVGLPLAKVEVRPRAVGRWRRCAVPCDFALFGEDLVRYGYAEQGAITRLIQADPRVPAAEEAGGVRTYDEWREQLLRAGHEIAGVVPPGHSLILVDEGQLSHEIPTGRPTLPFTERQGQYWGPPADDAAAIEDLERLRRAGAGFIAFAWPAFWWLDHYAGLRRHLDRSSRCVLRNDRLVVFELGT